MVVSELAIGLELEPLCIDLELLCIELELELFSMLR